MILFDNAIKLTPIPFKPVFRTNKSTDFHYCIILLGFIIFIFFQSIHSVQQNIYICIMGKHIYVTEPYLPDLQDFLPYIEKIWDNKWLTNDGMFHQELEVELAKFLGVKHISLFVNGTIALLVALKVLDINGEVITTPYSFVATSHCLIWNNNDPVFCDISLDDCNIQADKIEALITEKTSAILPVHVYGNPCNHKTIQQVAEKYRLKLVYDAAHAFAVEENTQSILNYGDLSVLSFHATKVFNTFEGGAIVSHSPEMKEKIDLFKNFGIRDEVNVEDIGINGKMNEIQSAMGLSQLKIINEAIEVRQKVADIYRDKLSAADGIKLFEPKRNVRSNYSYFPIIVEDDYPRSRDGLYEMLMQHNIYSRRYFYPLLSNLNSYNHYPSAAKEKLINSNYIADRILCMPIYPGLNSSMVDEICSLIMN